MEFKTWFEMANLCTGCESNYFDFLQKHHRNNEASLTFLRSHGVLPTEVYCPRCKVLCNYREDTHQWYCGSWKKIAKTKRRKQCYFSVSDYRGTFLAGTPLAPYKILSFVNHWLSKRWDYQTVMDCLGISEGTGASWQKYCAEVTEHWLDTQKPIGGPEVVVDIDETLFGKLKYEKGKTFSQIWVFGGIERTSKKFFVVPLGEPLNQNLIPLIQKHILPGSVIVSNRWSAYSTVSDHGYIHRVINHSGDLLDEENAEAHTKNIELLWHDVKEWRLKPGNRPQLYKQYLARTLFLQQHTFKDIHHHFFCEVARMYPPQFDEREKLTPPNQVKEDKEEPDNPEGLSEEKD